LVTSVYAKEGGTNKLGLLSKSYSFKSVVMKGLYFSIGTFRFIENAYELRMRHPKFNPLIVVVNKKNKSYFRVIVGPITSQNKMAVKNSLIKVNVRDIWLTEIRGPIKVFYEKTKDKNSLILNVKSKIKKSRSKRIAKAKVEARVSKKSNSIKHHIGEVFVDCEICPKQVVLPAGDFIMGEANGGLTEDAYAIHINIPKSFSISQFEITFDLWDACVADGGCSGYRPSDEGWGRAARPVINVNRDDILSYIDWLTEKTGKTYRLPSEAEWEYAARGGTSTSYWWGRRPGINRAVCQDCGSIYDGEKTARVGSFSSNKFNLFDTSGNVWEWVEDCYKANSYQTYKMYPEPFYIHKSSHKYENCSRVLRGGGWDVMSYGIQSSFRFTSMPRLRKNSYGFRVVREINQ